MGLQEEISTKNNRKNKIQRAILSSIIAVGAISLAALAPNAVKLLSDFGVVSHRRQRTVIERSRDRMVKAGLLIYNNKGFLCLTEKGEAKLRELELRDYKLKKPKRWDGKWRVLIFDIPEKRKGLRDKIRRTLIVIGFLRLQDSVWVYPYDCEDLITLLKSDFKVGKDLLYLIVESLENDKFVKKHFFADQIN